jgi:Zn-dependent protease
MIDITFLFSIAILIMSVVIHEVSHGIAALSQGDVTAKYEGRLTLNPLAHIDPVGSILVPLFCALLPGNLMFGWAKPVPVNPYNFKNLRWGEAIVAFAGPFSNICIALLAGLSLRLWITIMPLATAKILVVVVLTNIVLALFNLVPVPPLDGSKILFALLPRKMAQIRNSFEKYGFVLTLIFIFFLWQFFTPLIFTLFTFVTGLSA